MTQAECILASRLLNEAGRQFHEHGCNDMDPEFLEEFEPNELQQLVDGYNEWRRGGCDGDDWEPVQLANIGDDEWMAYLSDVLADASGNSPKTTLTVPTNASPEVT